jgi:SAM-dependent methyltransferase
MVEVMTLMLKQGDFTGLAANYAEYRPGYSDSVLTAILALVGKPTAEIDYADIGAGTGIWTRQVAARGVRSASAVEPNDDMRGQGIRGSATTGIHWFKGSGEATGLPDRSYDLLTMASAFHWVDFDRGTAEFARVLRPGGRFVALWNPRLIEATPLTAEIEAFLTELCPTLTRVSSGRSGLTETLNDRLWSSPLFDDVVHLEGRHQVTMEPERYLGVWRSVNDVQAQLGPERFARFLDYVESRIASLSHVHVTYLTRAWAARRRIA